MRISELARTGGVPVPTIKFYLREGLLPDGRRTSATQAQYDKTHVERLRLVRALLGPGGLSVARAKEVLDHLDSPPAATHDLLGIAHGLVTPPAAPETDLTEVHDLMRRWGWRIEAKDCDTHALLARSLAAIDDAGLELSADAVDAYAEAMLGLATGEIGLVPVESVEESMRFVILGTVLVEPLLLALRRVAQVEASGRRFGPGEGSDTITG